MDKKRYYKYILSCVAIILFMYSQTFALLDFTISEASLNNNSDSTTQLSTPQISLQISNIWTTDAIASNIPVGFLICNRQGATFQQVYISNPINFLSIAAGSFQNITNISLDSRVTNSIGPKNISCTVNANNSVPENNTSNNTINFSFNVIAPEWGRFDTSLSTSIDPIQWNLEARAPGTRARGIVDFIMRIIINIFIPIIIIIAVIFSIIGFYKLMIGEDQEGTKKATQYIIRGIVGIMIMVSARYIATILFDQIFSSWNLLALNGVNVVEAIYDTIAFPFLKVIFHIVLGVMFIILLTRTFYYITNPGDETRKKALTVIIRNVLGMLIILASKQIVELVYGQKEQVLQQNAQNIGDIGAGILENNIPILYEIINRILGFTAFVILIIIIFQSYQLLVNPNDPDTISKIKKNIGYIAIGVLVIGAGYVITNFLIIN